MAGKVIIIMIVLGLLYYAWFVDDKNLIDWW